MLHLLLLEPEIGEEPLDASPVPHLRFGLLAGRREGGLHLGVRHDLTAGKLPKMRPPRVETRIAQQGRVALVFRGRSIELVGAADRTFSVGDAFEPLNDCGLIVGKARELDTARPRLRGADLEKYLGNDARLDRELSDPLK